MRKQLFATVPDSSINSWVHGLFLTCGKINTCYYTNNLNPRIYMEKGFKKLFAI